MGKTGGVLVAGDFEQIEAAAGPEPDDADATEGGVVDLYDGGVEQVDVEAGKSIQVGGHDGDMTETAHERHDRAPCIACLTIMPATVDDVVAAPTHGRIKIRVEAVDLALEPVGITITNRQHRPERSDLAARSPDIDEAISNTGQFARVGNGEAEVVEPAPFEHRRTEPVLCRFVTRHLEDVQHRVAGKHDGVTTVVVTGADYKCRVEPDHLFVEFAEAIEVGGHHRDVADASGPDHRSPPRVGSGQRRPSNGTHTAPDRPNASSQRMSSDEYVDCWELFIPDKAFTTVEQCSPPRIQPRSDARVALLTMSGDFAHP